MPDIDAPLVRRLLTAQFPQWAELDITPVEPGGCDNRTFRLGQTMSVRLPSAERYQAQVAKEQRWLPHLARQSPMPIPSPIAMGEPVEDYPWHWSVYQWLEGKSASRSDIQNMNQFAKDLAQFLAAIQKTDASQGPPPGAHNFHRGGDLAVYDSQTRSAISALGQTINTARATEIWQTALASAWQRPPVWVHGDIAPGNLLVRNGILCAVIDFGCLGVGDPSADLAICWTFLDQQSRETFRATLPFDTATWARGRGWALWKALITAQQHRDSSPTEANRAFNVIDCVIADHLRQSNAKN